MKFRLGVILCIFFVASLVHAGEKTAVTSKKDKLSYSIGMNIGHDLKRQSVDIDPDMLAKGLKDAFSGGQTLMTEDEARQTLADFQKEMVAKQQESMKVTGEKNRKEGEAFLSANKKKSGVKTLPSGLQYKIIQEGKGESPKATDTVTVNYRGTLIDGTEFDSSYKRGQPATFPVNGVIKGWTEALQMMKGGAKWELYIPSDLAYGERGAGNLIGPNAVLIFEVELVSIKQK
jgi:FKBP-type peptidyl-prolyl cis-trans isomerase FklB